MKTTIIKPKKSTQAEKVSNLHQKQVAEICQYLDWNEAQYYNHQYEQYEEFLKRQFSGYKIDLFEKVRYSPIMRGFWNNEWIHRNETLFLDLARHILFEGMEVNDEGALLIIEPPEGAKAHVFDDYTFIHNGKLLIANEDFMVKFNSVLQIILV